MMNASSMSRPLKSIIPDLDGDVTVAELLSRLAWAEVKAASLRQQKRRGIFPMTVEELDLQLKLGRAGVSDHPIPKRMDAVRAGQAVASAFSDGLILLFVVEQRCISLDENITVSAETNVMIVRRTMLTG